MANVTSLDSHRKTPVAASPNKEVSENATTEVVIYPGINPRHLWRMWAEDCIAAGLTEPKLTTSK